MGLFRSVGNWFKSLFALFTGKVDSAREGLDTNPTVIKAKYDEIIRDKLKSVQQYKKAVAALVAQEEKKLQQVKTLSGDVERLENLKAGAAAKAKQVVAKLKGEGAVMAAIKNDPDYKRCLAAFNDFSSTLEEKKSHIEGLESDIGEYQKSVADHKVQLKGLMRGIEDLKSEASEAVADILTSKEEKEISDLLSGISTEGHNEELQRLRELRGKAKAEARISKEVAGVSAASEEEEFLDFARSSESSDEFDALIGLGEEAASTTTDIYDDKLPE